MCQPGFGLWALALVHRPLALAWRKWSWALLGQPWLGSAWLWPKLQLFRWCRRVVCSRWGTGSCQLRRNLGLAIKQRVRCIYRLHRPQEWSWGQRKQIQGALDVYQTSPRQYRAKIISRKSKLYVKSTLQQKERVGYKFNHYDEWMGWFRQWYESTTTTGLRD